MLAASCPRRGRHRDRRARRDALRLSVRVPSAHQPTYGPQAPSQPLLPPLRGEGTRTPPRPRSPPLPSFSLQPPLAGPGLKPESGSAQSTESLTRLAAEARAGEWGYLSLRIWPLAGTQKDSDDCQRGWLYCLDGEVGPTCLAQPAGTARPLCVNAPGSRLWGPHTVQGSGSTRSLAAAPARGLCSECSTRLPRPSLASAARLVGSRRPPKVWLANAAAHWQPHTTRAQASRGEKGGARAGPLRLSRTCAPETAQTCVKRGQLPRAQSTQAGFAWRDAAVRCARSGRCTSLGRRRWSGCVLLSWRRLLVMSLQGC